MNYKKGCLFIFSMFAVIEQLPVGFKTIFRPLLSTPGSYGSCADFVKLNGGL